jgi:hypothetical protein
MNVKNGSEPMLPARRDWPSTIGNFLLNFGTLDYLVFVLLKENLEATEFERYKERHFKDRVNRVGQHFRDNGWPTEKQAEFADLVRRLDSIRDLRNHIAHAHMLVRLETETNTLVSSASLPKDLDQEYSAQTRHVVLGSYGRASMNSQN